MRKKYKLFLLGLLVFTFAFVSLIIFFKIPFGNPPKCEGLCKWVSETKPLEEKIVIEKNRFSIKEVTIKKETGKAIFIENKDAKQHFVLEQCHVGDQYGQNADGWNFIIKPNETVSVVGFYNPPKEFGWERIYARVMANNAKMSTPYSYECMLICQSCETGFKSVKITLEK